MASELRPKGRTSQSSLARVFISIDFLDAAAFLAPAPGVPVLVGLWHFQILLPYLLSLPPVFQPPYLVDLFHAMYSS